jgi:hypothetical protein
MECPRCEGQGLICVSRVKGYTFFICDECDACWENVEDIYNKTFKDLYEFLDLKGISFEDTEVEYLDYI